MAGFRKIFNHGDAHYLYGHINGNNLFECDYFSYTDKKPNSTALIDLGMVIIGSEGLYAYYIIDDAISLCQSFYAKGSSGYIDIDNYIKNNLI